jgi:NAD(P)-dependent dehydrogenase (short-subunit alcohol dehydrogenase family)
MNLTELTRTYDFTGRTVVITGGTGALGSEMACALAGCGARVAILDIAVEAGNRLVQRIADDYHDKGGCALYLDVNVLDRKALLAAEETIHREFGPVDCLVNCAGGNHPSASTGPYVDGRAPVPGFFDLPEEDFRTVLDLNLVGTVLPCQVFGKGMAERGEGVILNMSSMNAFRPLTRIPAYSAAKAAVSNFTQWLAVYMAQNHSSKIRVNALAPGFFITEQSMFLLTDPATGGFSPRGQSVVAHTPMRRFGTPEDLLGAVLWLLSPAAAFVTGTVVAIDGGFSAFSGV